MAGYVDKDEALAVLRVVSSRTIAAVRGVNDVDRPAIGIWNIRDVAAHLGDSFVIHQAIIDGKDVPLERMDEIATVNQRLIDENPERDINKLADRIEQTAEAYLEHLGSMEGDPLVPWAEFKVPLSAVISADIGECLVHGYDIAQAESRPWDIDPSHAALALKGVSPMAINYVDPIATRAFEACFRLSFRGQWALDYIFDRGTLAIEEPSGRRPDVRIWADPVAFMLIGYGRVGQWGPFFKGKVIPYGRKPWLAMRFGSLLKNP